MLQGDGGSTGVQEEAGGGRALSTSRGPSAREHEAGQASVGSAAVSNGAGLGAQAALALAGFGWQAPACSVRGTRGGLGVTHSHWWVCI